MRCIGSGNFGPANENRELRIKYNNELYTLYKESDTVTYIKMIRSKLAGYLLVWRDRALDEEFWLWW